MIWLVFALLVVCGGLLWKLEEQMEHRRRVRRQLRIIERWTVK